MSAPAPAKAALRELKHSEFRSVWNSIRSAPLASPTAALLLVDMQRLTGDPEIGLGPRMREAGLHDLRRQYYDAVAEATSKAAALLAACRTAGLAIVHTHLACATADGRDAGELMRRHGLWARKGSPEADFLDPVRPVANELVLARTTFGFFTPGFGDQLLKNLGLSTLIIAGLGTDSSVASTARDASDRGYNTILVEDACAALVPEDHRAAVDFLELWYCEVADTRRVLQAIDQRSEVVQQPLPA